MISLVAGVVRIGAVISPEVAKISGKGRHQKKNYLGRDIVPISSDPPTYETDRDNLDRDNW